jgi:transposase
MDDNATAHRARIVNAFLDEQGIEWMYWPAQSPDLNPLEHAWDILQRQIKAWIPQP